MSVAATFAVPAEDMVLSEVVEANPGLRFELAGSVPMAAGGRHVWVSGEDRHVALDTAAVEVVDADFDRTLVRVEGAEPFMSLVGDRGAVLSATAEGGEWLVRIRFSDGAAVAALHRSCLDRGLAVALRQRDTAGRPDRSGPTPEQFDALRLAVERGYFAAPRRSSVQALAAELGVSESVVSERLRRGMRAVLAGTVACEREER